MIPRMEPPARGSLCIAARAGFPRLKSNRTQVIAKGSAIQASPRLFTLKSFGRSLLLRRERGNQPFDFRAEGLCLLLDLKNKRVVFQPAEHCVHVSLTVKCNPAHRAGEVFGSRGARQFS